MTAQGLTFRELIAPLAGDDFLENYYRRKPVHIPGAADKLTRLFSWDDLNGLLAMSTIWSPVSLELAADGNRVPPEAYCYSGTTRDNAHGLLPDFERVRQQLQQGATLTLNAIARLTPGLRAIAESLESVFGAPANAVAFCSFQNSPGYFSHFDTTNIFACHIAGSKRWRVYEGRHENAAEKPHGRGNDLSREHHATARGRPLIEVEMTPGDVLYVPHGQYHDAVATSDASLHITLAVRHLVVQDFVGLLSQDLTRDPFFRAQLPAYDDAEGHAGLGREVAERIGRIVADPSISQDLRRFLHGKAYERESAFALPERGRPLRYRVRWAGWRGEGTCWRHADDGRSVKLTAAERPIAAWMISRDVFRADQVAAAVAGAERPAILAVLQKLEQAGVLERL